MGLAAGGGTDTCMPQPVRTREENLALYSDTNAKEAKGVDLIRDVVEADGRLVFDQCAEGALADCLVHLPGAPGEALGIQLKTAHTIRMSPHGLPQHGFTNTNKYAGLLLVLVSFIPDTPRVWAVPGSDVSAAGISIPIIQPWRACKWHWPDHELHMGQIVPRLLEALSGEVGIVKQPVEELLPPRSPTQLKEYRAFMYMAPLIPLQLVRPSYDHQHFDYLVSGKRWQLKLAHYKEKGDFFSVTIRTSVGNVDGKPKFRQYAVQDFDFLALQLPQTHTVLSDVPARIYLFPSSMLAQRGLMGRNVASSSVGVYPHRPGTHWAEAYVLHLTSHAAFLESYARIMSNLQA